MEKKREKVEEYTLDKKNVNLDELHAEKDSLESKLRKHRKR